jgi:hypothetical protein
MKVAFSKNMQGWAVEIRAMRRLVFTCDGCDLSEQVVLANDSKADGVLRGWIAHRLVARENGKTTYEATTDLCPDCSVKLRHAINPTRWPRLEPVPQSLGKKPAA